MFESMSDHGSAKDRTDKVLRSWRMLGLDQWMRAGSALAAECYVQEEIAKAVSGSEKAKRNLRALAIDVEGVINSFNNNDEEALNEWVRMGSFTLTQQTNFATDPLTTPKVLEKSSPVLQLLTLFSRYSYHQHKFLADTIKNNPERLLRQIPST